MKQGTAFVLPVKIDMALSDMEQVDFIFVQDSTQARVKFTYPSDRAFGIDDNIIGLIWSESDTWLFKTNEPMLMDTKITCINLLYNPETPIVKLIMRPTLFSKWELGGEIDGTV